MPRPTLADDDDVSSPLGRRVRSSRGAIESFREHSTSLPRGIRRSIRALLLAVAIVLIATAPTTFSESDKSESRSGRSGSRERSASSKSRDLEVSQTRLGERAFEHVGDTGTSLEYVGDDGGGQELLVSKGNSKQGSDEDLDQLFGYREGDADGSGYNEDDGVYGDNDDRDNNEGNDDNVDSDIDDGLFEDGMEHVHEEDGEFEEHHNESPYDEDVDLEGWDDADDGEFDVGDDVVGADVDDDGDDDDAYDNKSDHGSGSDWDSIPEIDPDFDLADIFAYEREGSAMMPLPEREARLVDALLTWMEKHGDQSVEEGVRSKIQVLAISSPAFYSCAPPSPPLPPRLPLGVLASATTPAGSPLAAIPFPLWLSRLHGGWDFPLSRPAPPPPAPYKNAGDDVTVAAWLLREWRKGKESFYSPWINLLPGYVPLPLFWDEATLGELDSGEAIERVEEAIRYAEEAFSLCSDESIAGASMDEFKWAVAIVWSRSVPISAVGLKGRGKRGRRRGRGGRREGGGRAEEEGEDEEEFWQYMEEEAEKEAEEGEGEGGEGAEGEEVHMLLPLLDLFNHEFYYTADWQPTIHSSTADINIFAADVISPGQPISVGYGSMDTAQFLLLYGFVPPNNPFDRFVLFENADALLDYYETKYLGATSGRLTGGEGTFSEGEEGMGGGGGGGGGEGGGAAAAAGSDAGTVAGTDANNESDYTEKYPWLTGSFDRDLAAASVTSAIAAVEARQADYTAEHDLDRQLLGMAAGAVAGSEALAIGREGYVDARLLAALAAIGMPTHDPAFNFQGLFKTILHLVFRDGVTYITLKQQWTVFLLCSLPSTPPLSLHPFRPCL
ncbi:unnamed protein product [Closterium sp. Naga37s-1]|nr:unnamed protein product [Closterium sp. Naga37s-1]